MSVTKLTLHDLQRIGWAIDDIEGYLSDNSCGDPDCCGGPYYTEEDLKQGLSVLESYGLVVDNEMRDLKETLECL